MPLFQVSVLKKHLRAQDKSQIDDAWEKYHKHFFNPQYQHNVRAAKEEQYQAGFLRDLFVNILGYTLNPDPEFNLTTELKNIRGAKKTDGAIIKDGDAVAVIELKGTDTVSLDKIEDQAFGYKRNQTNCNYVITSNFEKLRFYIDDSIDYEDFPLFHLTKDQFNLLWLCLSHDSIMSGLPLRIKKESVTEEESVTKQLYKDYSAFRRQIFDSIVKRNPDYDKLTLFKSTQKLLDRFLFIFFAEDRGLLPPNSIRQIINQWTTLKDELDAYTPLYDRFRKYFGYLNTGHKGATHDIFAYNGGLFAPDTLLDTINIDDEILYIHTQRLSDYNFESEISVNILGHIFEHSLNEIEEIQAELDGQILDKSKSKRKKDGVYYTPKYITKYIVDNTVGRLCEEKKVSLGIDETEYDKGAKNRDKKIVKKWKDLLDDYRTWLLQLTICDPACGSGAFLNQALEYLIAEHQYIDTLETKLLGGDFVYPNVQNAILEHNLYGVDINQESVEIAKLSLWLRTAQKGRKLTSLNDNIKCGNSLIDNPAVAGDQAFKWKEEFRDVIDSGGFDIVLGNPPYGAKLDKESQQYLNSTYIKGGSETVISFLKLSHTIMKNKGLLGFIIPKSFSYSSNYHSIREFLLEDIIEIVDCKKVWSDVKLEQVIVSFRKEAPTHEYLSCIKAGQDILPIGVISKKTFHEFGFLLNGISQEEQNIGLKIKEGKKTINDIAFNQRGGAYQKLIQESGDIPVLAGANIKRHGVVGVKGYLISSEFQGEEKSFIRPASILAQNIVSHVENPIDHVKIIATEGSNSFHPTAALLDTINQITLTDDNYNTTIVKELLTSKLINWYCYRFIFGKAIRTMHFDNGVTSRIPIPSIETTQASLILDMSSQIKKKQEELMSLQSTYSRYLLQKYFDNDSQAKKLTKWHKLTFKQLINVIKKHGSFSLDQNSEYELFEQVENKVKSYEHIKSKIEINQSKLNDLIYSLYNLNSMEIHVIENQMP